ncbi:uncharacterized protein HMPREF1541_10354 [Cyphellophora europaea CBS 101466]|uniref:HSF-type DNA-binding domain-containing protein n=1 Tax=Cyphellophora europaea (strain CBS 101466) TaxID=1220924 RepID=W2S9T4_CYPE1|nr:uncharacterized protein HMPREF1541_10354 [Cyphellophora europaea CBS 101466]ETN44684.1 hypothetical protein HMPREF1541_10354 [Cyphellophora europaea CBS 101466]
MYAPNVGPGLSDDQFLQWGSAAQVPQSYDNNAAYGINNSYQQPQPSNQLTRRPMNQLTRQVGNQWQDQNGTPPAGDSAWSDDIQDLEAKAQVAKREAQSKRKQIPPFVQKLNSFLEDGKNTDLIRWSDDGNSFIVLDEDEFAKTLIPELFKHNNYASFVRQLNMYGFHKKVGLSDNSMRASERKNKSPSEYSNPYFRRGHQDLLWLIQKPKNAPTKKGKKADAEQADEDIDEYVEDIQPPVSAVRPRPQLALSQGDNALSPEQFQSIQRELQTIKHQQAQIQRMMAELRREQETLYSQAGNFQNQHTRHENSINAILTFLATVYNRSLQGHEGMQGIQNLFSGAIPNEQRSGTVVDVGDYSFDNPVGPEASPGKPYKKPPLLITDGSQQGRASTMSPSTAATSPYPGRNTRRTSQQYRTSDTPQPAVEEVFDMGNTPQSNQADIMNVIHNANARNGSSPGNAVAPDFSNMISTLENSGGANPLNSTQRADMLRLINSSVGDPSKGGDNALINATPPPGPSNFDRQLASSKASYDSLAKMQAEQDKSVQNLTNLLQPLSPSGSIPGIHDNANLPPAPWDVDDFLSAGHDYFGDFPPDGNFDPTNTNLGVDGAGANAMGGFDDYDDMFGGVPNPVDPNGAGNGRVDSASVASSEVATPEDDEDGKLARKGRKLSVNEADAPKKRSRRG